MKPSPLDEKGKRGPHVILLALNGDVRSAAIALEKRFPTASIRNIQRSEIEGFAPVKGLKALRRMRPDIFAVFMDSLDWQRGQNMLRVFGALTGAKHVALIDSHGGFRSEPRLRVLLNAPGQLVQDAVRSALAVIKSQRKLRSLERAVTRVTGFKNVTAKTGSPPRVFFLRATPGAGTQTGGAATHINGFINAAVNQGASMRMIANDPIAGLDEQQIPLTIIPLESVGFTRSAFDLHNNLVFTEGVLREVQQTPPDLIYQRYSRFTWAGVEASVMSGRPLFLEYNGSEVWVGKHWDNAGMFLLMERVERLNLNAAARVFVVSEVERRNLLKVGIPDQRIIVNPNGVDVERFHPGVGGEDERAGLDVHPDEVLVGFIGTFGPWHGVLELATAITLTGRESRIRFLLIGDGKLREPSERIISEAGMDNRVIFTGAVKHDRVPALLDACDILVSPHVPLADGSDFFGSPTKLFEYMAMGKGIIASRLGQIGEILKHDESALLVEPGNVKELAAGIDQLAASRELRQRLGESAIKEVVAHYTWEHNAGRVLSAYESWRQQTTDEK